MNKEFFKKMIAALVVIVLVFVGCFCFSWLIGAAVFSFIQYQALFDLELLGFWFRVFLLISAISLTAVIIFLLTKKI